MGNEWRPRTTASQQSREGRRPDELELGSWVIFGEVLGDVHRLLFLEARQLGHLESQSIQRGVSLNINDPELPIPFGE
ncbi:MAG TPA: hypothetical protein QGF05_11685 [Dehalococcoidia bacterium]|nr:hypothetical protein [Dehalococcoidia bacterium]